MNDYRTRIVNGVIPNDARAPGQKVSYIAYILALGRATNKKNSTEKQVKV